MEVVFGSESQENLQMPEQSFAYESWEDYVVDGKKPTGFVRPEILDSWARCRSMGLDPFSRRNPPSLRKKGLESLLRRNSDLIQTARPVVEMIDIWVRDSGFILTLAEKSGYVLMVCGDQEILEMAEKNYYLPGCLRSCEHAGTNAIGVALATGKPIQLTGPEHYNIHHHPWTCSSAPITDSRGRILGAITLSGKSLGRHRHTLALVKAAADIVRGQLRERDLRQEKQRLNSLLTSIFDSATDGLIAINHDLVITNLNKKAYEMFGLQVGSAIGHPLHKVIQPDESLVKAIKARDYSKHNETVFMCPLGRKSYICSIYAALDNSGQPIGAIINVTEKNNVIGIAKKFGGNYAKYTFQDIKGKNAELIKEVELSKIASKSNSRVLIVGESGSGKELFAQAIHNDSNRREEPFVAISCAAIPHDLIESELFGYQEGAFTGARRGGHVGKFELANNGTLFLDEVNGLPLDLQSKLLRVLQTNQITRLGDTAAIPFDVRIIAASSTDLSQEVEKSNFREDLYYRLNVVEVNIPPLRERMDDLELLIDHILERLADGKPLAEPKLSQEALEALKAYSWPGNIRELENVIERALLLSQEATIQKIHFPERLYKDSKPKKTEALSLSQGYRKIIMAALKATNGNMTMTAKKLGVSRSTLYRKMNEFQIH